MKIPRPECVKIPGLVWQLFARPGMDVAREMMKASLLLARSTETDDVLVVQLRQRISDDIGSAWRLKGQLETHRHSYDYDRAYRLLVAALTNTPVQPPEASRRARLKEEEELGRLPLRDAFERLGHVVPELAEMRRDLEAKHGRSLASYSEEIKKLMGHGSPHEGELAGSAIAIGIARSYCEVLAGDTRRGDAGTPYFVMVGRPRMTVWW
jgi:hypothetical protein